MPLIDIFVPDYLFDLISIDIVLELFAACDASIPFSVVL